MIVVLVIVVIRPVVFVVLNCGVSEQTRASQHALAAVTCQEIQRLVLVYRGALTPTARISVCPCNEYNLLLRGSSRRYFLLLPRSHRLGRIIADAL